MKFWDASALIPLCLHERQTALLRKFAKKTRHCGLVGFAA